MKLTLGKKLGMGFGVILALMILSSVLTYVKASSIQETQVRAMTVRVPSIGALKDLQRDLNQTQSKGRQAVLSGNDSARWEAAKNGFDSAWDDIGKDVAQLDELAPGWSLQENRNLLTETKQELSSLRESQEGTMKQATSSEHDAVAKAGIEFADKATVITEAIKKPLNEIADSFATLLKQNSDDMKSETRSMNLTMAITTLAALCIGIFVAIYLSRGIAGATQSVLIQAEAIAAGDLTRDDLKVRSQDELGDLTTAINKMSGSLKRIILSITENAVQVASASEELNRHQPADYRQLRGNLGPGRTWFPRRRRRSARTCRPSPPARKRWAPASRKLPRTPPKPPRSQPPPSRSPRPPRLPCPSWAIVDRDWTGHQSHHLDRAADQPARAERHDRSGARRRGGQRVCRGGQRSERTGQGNRQGHRRHQPQDRGDPDGHQGRGGCDCHDQRSHQPDQRHLEHDRHGGGRAERDHQ